MRGRVLTTQRIRRKAMNLSNVLHFLRNKLTSYLHARRIGLQKRKIKEFKQKYGGDITEFFKEAECRFTGKKG